MIKKYKNQALVRSLQKDLELKKMLNSKRFWVRKKIATGNIGQKYFSSNISRLGSKKLDQNWVNNR